MLKSSCQHNPAQTLSTRQEASFSIRNPWVEKHLDTSSNSSSGDRAAAVHRLQQQQQQPPQPFPRHQQHHGPLLNYQHQQQSVIQILPASSIGASSRAPTTHGGSSQMMSTGGGGSAGGCGGRCFAFDTCCYYCLQVVFVTGILTGVSLTIAGSVLRSTHRGGSDLMVLTYIGVLLSLVCCLLLSVHCCVRRNTKQRRRLLRGARVRPPSEIHIPMQELHSQPQQPQQALPHPHQQYVHYYQQRRLGQEDSDAQHSYQPLMHRAVLHSHEETMFRR